MQGFFGCHESDGHKASQRRKDAGAKTESGPGGPKFVQPAALSGPASPGVFRDRCFEHNSKRSHFNFTVFDVLQSNSFSNIQLGSKMAQEKRVLFRHASGRMISLGFELARQNGDLSSQPLAVFYRSLPIINCAMLPVDYANAIYSILGKGSEEILGIEVPKKKTLQHDHLFDSYDGVIHWELMEKDSLNPSVRKGDLVFFMERVGVPYLIADYNRGRSSKNPDNGPKGWLDPAITVKARDLVWLNSSLCFVSPTYFWTGQYLYELVPRPEAIKRLLYNTPAPGIPVNYSQLVKYDLTGDVELSVLPDICELDPDIRVLGPNRTIVRKGMGVVFDFPLHVISGKIYLEAIYGSVISFKNSDMNPHWKTDIIIRAYLSSENVPDFLLSELKLHNLLQTNIVVTISEERLLGTFSIWPPILFQGSCIPSGNEYHFHDRIVVGHLEVSFETQTEDWTEPFVEIYNGTSFVTFRRVTPLPAIAILPTIHFQNRLSQFSLDPLAYTPSLYLSFHSFAEQKVQHLRTSRNQHSFRPPIPGRSLMDLLFRRLPAEDRQDVNIKDLTLTVTVTSPLVVDKLFHLPGKSVEVFDFRSDGFGVVKLSGPITFKWEMCDSEDETRDIAGKVLITVAKWTEFDRSGLGDLKSTS